MGRRMLQVGLSLMLLLALIGCGQAGEPAATEPRDTEQTSSTPTTGTDSAPETPQSGQGSTSGSGNTTSHGGPVTDQVSLIDHLRAQGLTVEIGGNVDQPFASVQGTSIKLSGGPLSQAAELQVFNYESAAQAEADASQIGPDGNLKTTIIEWMAPPHFFRQDKVLVLYLGSDQQVLDLLTQLLGPQFAGQ